MSHQSDLIATDIDAYLAQHEQKELLRFLTCGSVDDGKSTLIGRLLYDSKMIYEDQLAAVKKDSLVHGTTGDDFDPALLTDGLKAEREQGITIDVAYRYFSTAKRKFIIADTPGHEQYTRNMATGASTCDLAIILVDARHGVSEQTKRHSFITELLGIKHVIVAVNKMDLASDDHEPYSEELFERIKQDYIDFTTKMNIDDVHFIPISALHGDNVVDPSPNMPWYVGATLMHMLDNVHIASDRNLIDFRFPVQLVLRPDLNFRGYCGTIASGIIRKGDEIMVLPSRTTTRVKSIVTYDGVLDEAFAPQSATLTLEDEVDVSRGDTIVHTGNVPQVAARFESMVVWMDEEPMVPGKQYLVKQCNKTSQGTISTLRYRVDVNTLKQQPAPALALNEIGRCTVKVNQAFIFDPYRRNRDMGSFIIIDRLSNRTVGAGMILDRTGGDQSAAHWDEEPSTLLHAQRGNVSDKERSARFGQQPFTVLLTGISGVGKSTTAFGLERRLFEEGRAVVVLDGQNMRQGISRDLGFTAAERSENLRRSAEVAKLMNEAGLICVCAFVAPNDDVRYRASRVVGKDRFLIVHLTAPTDVCRARDQEGLYAAADAGEIADFPGVSSKYEIPLQADLIIHTDQVPADEAIEQILQLVKDRGFI